ncbi:hypothetical protein EVAR_18777_1 [Eumeta japonica]|uniref:Uncharacterized protein n=1 Tax=Eumeta variegata TaxID=151549 RepID=A0A4C1UMT7_EUMVA|nr:hypothetical protein EVAR_18777_1 [Eumeta japonica]
MTVQTMKNLKLVPQRVEYSTVAACFHLKDIAESLIFDAAAPCILFGQDNWGLIVWRSHDPACRLLDPNGLGSTRVLLQFITADKYDTAPMTVSGSSDNN